MRLLRAADAASSQGRESGAPAGGTRTTVSSPAAAWVATMDSTARRRSGSAGSSGSAT